MRRVVHRDHRDRGILARTEYLVCEEGAEGNEKSRLSQRSSLDVSMLTQAVTCCGLHWGDAGKCGERRGESIITDNGSSVPANLRLAKYVRLARRHAGMWFQSVIQSSSTEEQQIRVL